MTSVLLSLLLSVLSLIVFLSTMGAESSEDYVPNFFGGRRNEGQGNSGMGPPRQPRPKARSGSTVWTMNISQKLDHFNKCNRRVWNQRYMVNDKYYEPRIGGPIFIRIGGEDEISEEDIEDGPVVRLAKRHKALVLSLEHRFYGESKPTLDIRTSNLRYLSSKQALADLDAFILNIKKQYEVMSPNAKVVLFGCSYSGSLAAFHRRLYPNSTAGAIAGFAPIFAVANFRDYFVGFWQTVRDESAECEELIDGAIVQIVCLTDSYSDGSSDLGTFCRYLVDRSNGRHVFQRYGAWRKEMDGRCVMHQGKAIQTLGTDWTNNYARDGTRQWLYQMCSEFGYFMTAGGDDMLNTRYYKQTCEKSFSIVDVERNVDRTNKFYGERQGMNATNVYFLNSAADPWYGANGLAEERTPANPTVRVKTMRGISHCYEPMGDCSEEKELADAWNDIDGYVSQWIGTQRRLANLYRMRSLI